MAGSRLCDATRTRLRLIRGHCNSVRPGDCSTWLDLTADRTPNQRTRMRRPWLNPRGPYVTDHCAAANTTGSGTEPRASDGRAFQFVDMF